MRVCVYGAGQHGACVWACLTAAGHEVVAFVDDRRSGQLYGRPIVGSVAEAPAADGIIVAIGDNAARRNVGTALIAAGIPLVTAVHPRASVSSRVTLGRGAVVLAGAIISVDAEVGDGAIVDVQAALGHHVQLGAWSHAVAATIGARSHVGDGAFLGIGCRVLPGISVGAWSVCAAGSLITKDVPNGAVMCGAPARARIALSA